MITFKEYLNEIAIKGKAYKKKKVTEAELRELINTENKNKELENLDVSDITNMSGLFEATDYGKWEISDIDDWNTSNVLNSPLVLFILLLKLWVIERVPFNGIIFLYWLLALHSF